MLRRIVGFGPLARCLRCWESLVHMKLQQMKDDGFSVWNISMSSIANLIAKILFDFHDDFFSLSRSAKVVLEISQPPHQST